MSKRKKVKLNKPRLGDCVMRPDGSIVEFVRESDDEEQLVEHFRCVDSLAIMLRNQTITVQMHDAGRLFEEEFYAAQLSGIKSPSLIKVDHGPRTPDSMTDRCAFAHRRIGKTLEVIGGPSSPGGAALWFVVGLGMSVREWALRQGWNGSPLRSDEARGILVASLGVLAKHYGLVR
jgi:hypothetical protein